MLQQASSSRLVRTVPPSARFDPPEPEVRGTTSNSVRPLASPVHHESSGSESDSDSSNSVPWWTFTSRGMAKLRAAQGGNSTPNSSANAGNAVAGASDSDVRETGRRRKRRRGGSGSETPDESRMRRAARDARAAWHFARSRPNSFRHTPTAPPMQRSSSAPSMGVIRSRTPPPDTVQMADLQQRNGETPGSVQTPRNSQEPMLSTPGQRSKRPNMKNRSSTYMIRRSRMSSRFAEQQTQTPTESENEERSSSKPWIQLPPNVYRHFDGWPHAGTWQDAYYGFAEEPGSYDSPKTPMPRQRDSTSSMRLPRRLQGMAPPTPNGLGFEPTRKGETGSSGVNGSANTNSDGFDWNTEKVENEKRGSFARHWQVRKERRQQRLKEDNWRKRWRRMLFLDARVTIWIRILNLAIVVAALGLAVTIRMELDDLSVPGAVGSSTTIIIAYSSLTTIHVLLAIYREYFGRPIGLWGLRSKMLWVCLDLVFVALWSSATSAALNDYIGTPLMCSSGKAWWAQNLKWAFDNANDPDGSGEAAIGTVLPSAFTDSAPVKEVCRRQMACGCLSLVALLLYGGNMVLSLFRIFETVRRTARASEKAERDRLGERSDIV